MKHPELHLHSLDQFDSDNYPERVCKRLKELGAEGFALTQHGVLSGIEPMREKAAEYGLKFIPGIETYYGNEEDLTKTKHLILLSKNYEGYRAIWRAVSDRRSQNKDGRSVMNEEILREYFGPGSEGHGNVFATSACIGGVLSMILRSNDIVDEKIAKLKRKNNAYENSTTRYETSVKNLEKIDSEISRLNSEKDGLLQLANAKFAAREKQAAKLKEKEDPKYAEVAAKLEEDKSLSAEAAKTVECLKSQIATLKKKRSAVNAECRQLGEMADKEKKFSDEIAALESKKLDKKSLYIAVKEEAEKFVEIFGNGNFFVEIQNHGIETEKEVYPKLAQIARKIGIPIVATNDVHTVDNSEEELLKRQILRSLRFQQWEEQEVGDDQLYIKTDEDFREWLGKIFTDDVIDEAFANIDKIFNECNVEFPEASHYPVYPSEDGKSANTMLKDAIRKGAAWRFPEGMDQVHKDRVNYEFGIIRQMGYADYHLIVKDFLEYGRALGPVPDDKIEEAPYDIEELKAWTKKNGWEGGFTIGPGRGSGVGSLVCYLLGITSLDPLKYDLLFERFLNPERVSMPDIDSDLANRIRAKVIEYVRHKYGEDSVCGIMTTNAQAPRGTVRIAAKYYGLSKNMEKAFLALSDEMAKLIPNEPGISFSSMVSSVKTVSDMLRESYADNEDALTIIKWAEIIEGCFTAYGAHAAGVVISDGNPVSNYIPLRWNEKLGEMTTQVDMNRVEAKGLIKMDFLGLRTLDIITDCLRMIRKRHGLLIDPLKDIDMDDKKIYSEIFAKAKTNSVFQFESSGMKNMLKRFRPETFEDLIILVSMFRPGPLQYLDGVIETKKSGVMHFLTPELEPILGKTYGAIVYQEQVMEIFQKLAGYTLGGADQVRRFMSKKKMDKLVHEKEAFIHGDESRNIDGCVKRGIDEKKAEQLFDQMTDFAKYAFNKSHAAAYAANSYYTAWLKYYYPAEFLAAALIWAPQDKIAGLMQESKDFGITVLVPDVNKSEQGFIVDENGCIRFGLSAIKSVGSNAGEIINKRNEGGTYRSLEDFFRRTSVNKGAIEALIKAGAFDCFSTNRKAMLSVIETYQKLTKELATKQESLSEMKKLLPYVDDIATDDELTAIKTSLGITSRSVSKPTTSKKLEKRIQTAEETVKKLDAEINDMLIPDIEEDMQEKMAAEKELLGSYVTSHPLDAYDPATEYGASDIDETISSENTGRVKLMCVIDSFEKRIAKSGKPYATLLLEDKSQTIKACMFNAAMEKYGNMLKEYEVYIFEGNIKSEVFVREDGEEEVTYTLFVNSIANVPRKGTSYITTARSESAFREYEDYFRKNWENPNGHRMLLHLQDEDRILILPYRVDQSLLEKKTVKILEDEKAIKVFEIH